MDTVPLKGGTFDYHARKASVVQHCDLCVLEDHRLFYICHASRTSHWEPPWASWRCRLGLPYGWEQARDQQGHPYFIDHINRQTTYADPRKSTAPAGKRTVKVRRKQDIGFGFVAAGQQPTVIQFVSPEGPSDGLLYANDQILSVDGEEVSDLTKEEVVERVRSASDEVELTVEQLPQKEPRTPRRNYKVRFTDRVIVANQNGESSDFPPAIPNVLRVYLENGQTRSFKYDDQTTVKEIVSALMAKLQMVRERFFALAVEYSLGARTSRVSLLRQETKIVDVLAMPNAAHFRCVLRFAFISKEIPSILEEDRNAFEYFYQQCVNDVVRGRFAYEMRYEACVRLAALQMQQVALESSVAKEGRVSVSRMEKEYGLDIFLPAILLDNVKRKEIRKHLRFYLKKDDVKASDYGSNGKTDLLPCTSDEIGLLVRLKYLHIVSHLPSFGGRGFSVTFKESQIDMIMQIDPRNGLLVRHPGKTGQPAISIGFDLIGRVVVRTETEVTSVVSIRLAANEAQGLEFIVERDDVDDLLSFLCGYHEVQQGSRLSCDVILRSSSPPARPNSPPPYSAVHTVVSSGWNYSAENTSPTKTLDLTEDPPLYELANTFDDAEEDGFKQLSLKEIKMNGDAKQKLKAKDSLLIKNCRDLHFKEMASPILRRPSNPTGCKMEIVSDSSDTEDSSFSSPMRSPGHSARSDDTESELAGSSELLVPECNGRRASIETLIQTAPSQFASNLETLILMFPDNPMESSITTATPLDEQKTIISNGYQNGHKRMSLKGYLEGEDALRLIDD